MSAIEQEKLDRATWPALARAFRIAEEALVTLSDAEPDGWIARKALEKLRAEVERCR